MRAYALGIGYVCDVPSSPRCGRNSASDVDRGCEKLERKPGLVDRLGRCKYDAGWQWGGDGVEIADSARGEHGSMGLFARFARTPYRMRDDGVEFRHCGEVSNGAWCWKKPARRNDGVWTDQKHD